MTSPSSSYTSSFFSRFCSSAIRSKPLSSSADAAVITSSGDGLVRRLGLFDLILMGIGASIGAGIFFVTGTVARDAGPGVTLSFIIAGACCVLNALCYAELASRFPAVVGGAYLYTYSAFNELTAFLVFAQLVLDYHIGAASIALSLASYVVTVLELIPFLKDNIPSWVAHGEEVFGALSINILAPILLVLLTVFLCRSVGESSILNSIMTVTKSHRHFCHHCWRLGAFKVDVSNWTPFAPTGFGSTRLLTLLKNQRGHKDLPLGIVGSLVVCMALYIGVCLVLTGMVPYQYLGEDVPLAGAFTSRGLKYVSVLISFGAVAGLTTTLLVRLYVQCRLYLGLGRDCLLPSIFAKVQPNRHTPVHHKFGFGLIAIILSGLFNTRYSFVSTCVISLRWKDKAPSRASTTRISTRGEGIICLLTIACCGFVAGALFRYDVSRERKSKVEDLGLTDEALFEELEYTSELVWNDPRHTYAWSHRQWALDRLGRGYADELGLCEHLGHRTHMRLIWDQRCFAVRKCLAKGIAIIRSCEIRVAANAIKRNPEDENPWRYLRFLFKNDMNALAQSPHLRWVLKSVFVQARDSVNSVIADQKMYKHYKYAWLFDSVNKRGCLFALDLLSDLLKYDEYKLDNEFIEAFKDVFQEYHGKTIAEKVDSVLREHRMELMELCEDFTRMITDITGGMDTTPPVDLEGVTAQATLSYEDNGSKIVGVMRSFFPCSELCDEAGFSSFSDNPNWRPGVSKDESYKEWPTIEVTEDDHDDQYSVLTESLRNIWRQMDT
ncbi:hypothetical protein CASFOL_041149 [Castilleja foliolosa]|uniref:Amino acid permease/ SLC12A domain-containing protein n=1 Tax=Castilleja foliolosa TaxID=1961234 RepID=A0ABD3BDL2_9LAMI